MSYVPELPPAPVDKENASRPRYKTLSSKNGAPMMMGGLSTNSSTQSTKPTQQQQPPRSALGSLSLNIPLSSNPQSAKSSTGVRGAYPADSIRSFGTAFTSSSIPSPKSSIGLPSTKTTSSTLKAPPSSLVSNQLKGSDPLSQLIRDTDARNARMKQDSMAMGKPTSAPTTTTMMMAPTMTKRKSLLNQDMLQLQQPNHLQSLFQKTQPMARLKGSSDPLNISSMSAISVTTTRDEESNNNKSFMSSAAGAEMKRSFEEDLERAKQAAMRKEQEERELRLQEQEERRRQEEELMAKQAREAQEAKEEEERAQRRKQQRDEEVKRKTADLVARARELEASGKIAAALALFKEASGYLPDNEKLKARVEKLRTQLRGTMAAATSDGGSGNANIAEGEGGEDAKEDDPLEALFRSNHQMAVPSSSSSSSEVISTTSSSSSAENKNEEKETFMVKLVRLVDSSSQSNHNPKAMGALVNIFKALLEMEKVQRDDQKQDMDHRFPSTTERKKRVTFFTMDCAITPPPQDPPSNDEFESALYPVDRIVDALTHVLRACDDARKTVSKSFDWRSTLQEFAAILQSSNHNISDALSASILGYSVCAMHFGLGLPTCACVSDVSKRFSHCHYGAISPKDVLGRVLSTGLRCCLRRAFNRRGNGALYLSGSYKYACGDIAAVAHQALLMFETRQQVVDSIVLIGKSTGRSDGEENSQIAKVGEFVEAHKFLSALFPSEEACLAMTDADSVCWAKIRKYLSVARDHRCEDELVLSSLAALPVLVKKLQEQTNLVNAARGHVDLAFRRAMKEDSCGQCTCEGARRRRASALGTWIAPQLMKETTGAIKSGRECGKCSKNVAEKDEQIACECCEKRFHVKCVGLPGGYNADFVCSKCVPKFKKTTATNTTEDDE